MPAAARREIGQLLIGSFAGPSVPVELRALAREFDLGGAILFGRNIEEPEQVAELSFALESLGRSAPAWVSVDQEGGRVARLGAPFTVWPPMATLGRAADDGLAVRFARALAAEMRAAGITLDWAPVLDVRTNPHNRVIGDRALAETADVVARLGRAIVATLQANGVAACGKHFPGHGDTDADSHCELPVVDQPPERLRQVEGVPFRAAIEAGVAAIMTAHVLVPAVDARLPATLSPTLVQGWLRDEFGFDGLVVTDDLEMKALAGLMPVPELAVAAISAGCDAVLVCSGDVDRQVRVLEAVVRAVEDGRLPRARVDDALRRGRVVKGRFLAGDRPGPAARVREVRQVIGRDEHHAVAQEMAAFL